MTPEARAVMWETLTSFLLWHVNVLLALQVIGFVGTLVGGDRWTGVALDAFIRK